MDSPAIKVMCVVGARPNFMKIAPVIAALREVGLGVQLVHTGQHYDVAMQQQFFEQLGIPQPDMDLEVGSASHAVQTAEIMRRFEPVLDSEQPHTVLVVGDVNSTVACALVAVKKNIPVVHVEAGLRSYDRSMPEEINRVLTDQISELLFTTEAAAADNLRREGIDSSRIHFVGNVMIDTLYKNLEKAIPAKQTLSAALDSHVLLDNGFAVLTLHRPSNVDEPGILTDLLNTILKLSEHLPIVFPVHPRTAARIDKIGMKGLFDSGRILRLSPLGYLEMLGLMLSAKVVLTDSGGMQEETTALNIPCLTLRENTERPITVLQGTNTIVGTDPERIEQAFDKALSEYQGETKIPDLWDGRAAQRIGQIMKQWLA
ncbi:non-hydrolyzing UDP-N-acetylglucosamine 2-epimerase [Nitrosococcus wardiae]|uniref:UDP-N-acetylglucosamine 2-epimerase (Non-hydrolyzing) n=1 Tax=Nitrosococcus wardiae TaxID=1814290 RepID=A0A4P7BWL1_9GAMM|nr:UDP-N-acetylglucosamine 2-epimerase (non-hydrolyzing) [Nitrosococcus wardiae]QBQ54478.1 UDP-N-acetylglucosamine 2-epimerase (non-hydrolyzing) [Nitrosococcus wardiae]